jgi:hypothetical protein
LQGLNLYTFASIVSPIEQAFHSIKPWLRRHEAEAISSSEVRPWFIELRAVASVSTESAEEGILNCGYSFEWLLQVVAACVVSLAKGSFQLSGFQFMNFDDILKMMYTV